MKPVYYYLIIACSGIAQAASAQTFFQAITPKTQIEAMANIDSIAKIPDSKDLYINEQRKVYEKLNLDALNKTPRADLYTSLGANGSVSSDQVLGSGTIGAKIRLTDFKRIGKKGWIDPHYVYLEYRTRLAKSADTSTFQKTFIFPELNKSDFILGYFSDYTAGAWTLLYRVESSLNKYTNTDSTDQYFESQSILTGIQAKKQVIASSNNWLMFGLDYQILHVDQKFEKDFRRMIGEPKSPLAFHTFNFTAALGPPNAALFCTMKYIVNGSDRVNSANLTRLVYTVGLRAIISSNTFKIP